MTRAPRAGAVRTSTVLDTSGGDALLARRLKALDDTSPALRAVADIIREQYRVQYRRGTGWAELTANYRRRKAAAGRGSRVLVDRGLLEASLTRRGVRYARQAVSRDSVEVRSTNPVGNLLANGTRRMRPRDPGRIDLRAVQRESRDALLAHLGGA